MIFYTITDSMPVRPDWSGITGSLKAGTPISVKGAISNDDGAVGLVAADTAHGAEAVLVVTAGVVDLAEASASYGSAISDDCVKALDNVAFIYGGKVYTPPPVPFSSYFVITLTPTAEDLSGTMDKTSAEIRDAFVAGKTIICDVPSVGASFAPTQYVLTDDYLIVAGTIVYSISDTPVLVYLQTDSSIQAYHTNIYPLSSDDNAGD